MLTHPRHTIHASLPLPQMTHSPVTKLFYSQVPLITLFLPRLLPTPHRPPLPVTYTPHLLSPPTHPLLLSPIASRPTPSPPALSLSILTTPSLSHTPAVLPLMPAPVIPGPPPPGQELPQDIHPAQALTRGTISLTSLATLFPTARAPAKSISWAPHLPSGRRTKWFSRVRLIP